MWKDRWAGYLELIAVAVRLFQGIVQNFFCEKSLSHNRNNISIDIMIPTDISLGMSLVMFLYWASRQLFNFGPEGHVVSRQVS